MFTYWLVLAIQSPEPLQQAGFNQADIIMLLLYVSMALLISFLCSIAEAVLLSLTPSFIAGLAQKKPKLAQTLSQLKEQNIDQSLAAILTLNTIAHTVGAIGSGAKATVVFGSQWFGVFSAVMTLMILFLSEIVPKTLGAVYWKSLAKPTALFVRFLVWALFPLIWISEKLTKMISAGKSSHGFNREEFIAMAGLGTKGGHLHERESKIIHNLFRFGALKACDVMTPRTVVFALAEDQTVGEALEKNPHFTRIPIYGTSFDDWRGFVLKDDLLLAAARDQENQSLDHFKRELFAVPEEMSLSELLETLLEKKIHIAVVVGKFGEARGLVSLEDVVETLLGMEIVDEVDTVTDMQALARQKWESRHAKTETPNPKEP
ncbi:MAG: DUF21 domain-containing protein [Acidobacteria bacterium]|nr:DUF21 domain-containing protein [Acidobacteriota bacterium]